MVVYQRPLSACRAEAAIPTVPHHLSPEEAWGTAALPHLERGACGVHEWLPGRKGMFRHHRQQFQGTKFDCKAVCHSEAPFPHECTLDKEEIALISRRTTEAIRRPLFQGRINRGSGTGKQWRAQS